MTRPYDTSKFHGRKFVTHKMVKLRERMFDPVSQKYNSSERELREKNAEQKRRNQQYEKARRRDAAASNRWKNPYHILTHDLKELCHALPEKVYKKVPDTRTSYDILNHTKRLDGTYLVTEKISAAGDSGVKVERGKRDGKGQDYNIVSNKFFDDHEAKHAAEVQKTKDALYKKYRETRVYNPVTSAYFDAKKEREFQNMRRTLVQSEGFDRSEFLPTSTKHSEGQLYNIVNQTVKRPGRLKLKEERDSRRIQAKMKANSFEEEVKRRQERKAVEKDLRSLNRSSYMRDVRRRARGYDPITNTPFEGFGRKLLPPTRTSAPPKMWERAYASAKMSSLNILRTEAKGRGNAPTE